MIKSENKFMVNVQCPEDKLLHPMEIIMVDHPNGRKFVLPVNGCDDFAGCKQCEQCRAAVTLMFYNGYERKNGEPLIPDFEVLK